LNSEAPNPAPYQPNRETILAEARPHCAGPLYSVASSSCERSPVSRHAYYSEGTYWWPNESDPAGPYVKKDGLVYPGAFFDHANSLLAFCDAVSCLAVAYRLSAKKEFLARAADLVEVWFLNEETFMEPHLLYSQGIPGTCPGRCYGIIDTHHFAEVTLAVRALENELAPELVAGVRDWLKRFNHWLIQSEFGREEKAQPNNHSIYYLIQVAAYALFTGDQAALDETRAFFKQVIVPNQIASDGSMPMELKRTKSFAYSVFAANGLAILGKLLSTENENIFEYETPDGRGIRKATGFLFPYLSGASSWPRPDISGFTVGELAPIAPLFVGQALGIGEYLAFYASRAHHLSTNFEIRRDQSVKQPWLWVQGARPWTL